MEETVLLRVLSLIRSENPVEIYALPAFGDPTVNRTLIMSGDSTAIDPEPLDGYVLSGFYVSNGTLIFEVYEDSSNLEDDLTLSDILGYMYSQEEALVVYHKCNSRPLTTIHCGTVSDLMKCLCSDSEVDANVVHAINVSNAFIGDNFDKEEIVSIELYEPRDISEYL